MVDCDVIKIIYFFISNMHFKSVFLKWCLFLYICLDVLRSGVELHTVTNIFETEVIKKYRITHLYMMKYDQFGLKIRMSKQIA